MMPDVRRPRYSRSPLYDPAGQELLRETYGGGRSVDETLRRIVVAGFGHHTWKQVGEICKARGIKRVPPGAIVENGEIVGGIRGRQERSPLWGEAGLALLRATYGGGASVAETRARIFEAGLGQPEWPAIVYVCRRNNIPRIAPPRGNQDIAPVEAFDGRKRDRFGNIVVTRIRKCLGCQDEFELPKNQFMCADCGNFAASLGRMA